ncbi:MAG TPA: tyrosine-type recombinase/integrase [Actinomycetota bacterium]|nr:tyrosine-type recombinase/integrase [Actinomycetota bacterium]
MGSTWRVPGAAPGLLLDASASLLRPEDQVLSAMVDGWRDQQLARNLNRSTIEDRLSSLARFQRFTNEYPWQWRPQDVEQFTAHLRSGARPVARTTVRSYQAAIRQFLDYATDPRYQWNDVCLRLFGTHPAQICFEWNMAVHSVEQEGRPEGRSLTRVELQRLFDFADDQVAAARQAGNKAWLPLLRDAATFKVAYAWGLRRREVVMLDVQDFGTNPHASEFGDRGVVYVRWGKANKGSAPKRRSVLTVFPWSVRVVNEWLGTYRDLFDTAAQSSALWPSERSARVGIMPVGARFAEWRDAVGLPEQLGMHCLRHSYVTHLIEDGRDPLFVQQQVGHSYASTTALYTSVSSDFRTRTVRSILDGTVTRALADGAGEGS